MTQSKLKKNFQLGTLTLPNNIFYAPLAGCSDLPFRKMSAIYRPGLFFCEMVKMDALIRKNDQTFQMLDFEKSMHPIGAQVCGSKVEFAKVAAKIIEDLGFDVLDLNCGCPVDKVTKDGSGSALLKTPNLIGEIISEMKAAVSIPVTLKIRTGWDESTINAPQITKIAEEAGAVAITIHGRTRKQGYEGFANWDIIKQAKEVAKNILVIGNGDIKDFESANGIFDKTSCDGILLGRATMGKPWIVKELIDQFEGKDIAETTLEMIKDHLLQHFEYIASYRPEKNAIFDMRRVGCWYLKHHPGAKNLRKKLTEINSIQEGFTLAQEFI